MEVAVFSFGEASCLVVVQTFIFDAGSVNGTRYCNEILLPYVHLFLEALWVCSSFSWTTMHHVIAQKVAAEQLLESEDIERMDWLARSPDLNPIEHVADFLGRRLVARTLPPVTTGSFDWRCKTTG
ncbi:hypothetical protein TNCV_3374381 [Trichonephila clavipes]|nr:hypothetical protein TNCV_3374381 [Trichonephila clavipes]